MDKAKWIKQNTTPTQYKYMLLYFNGMSYGQIAKKLGKNKTTVWRTVRRGVENSLRVQR